MSDRFSRFEAQLERLIEGAFTHLFGKTIRPQDIALRLSRAMEDHLRATDDADPRSYAPDQYVIHLDPGVCAGLLEQQPSLPHILSQHLIELALFADYRLNSVPRVELVGDHAFDPTELEVIALHSDPSQNRTAVMESLEIARPEPAEHKPRNPQLVINGTRVITLQDPLINIGRSRDNHIVLNDQHVSRHHVQLRLRFGHYTVFDSNSQSGTRVNDVSIREHRLQPGDVIRIGKTQIVYIEDAPLDGQTGVAASLHS
ncbi:MAG: FhaA domain-containing protein [bacterium]|nr:FhaA domain-containing protein [bacterium]